jgi:hypothetical protein
LAVAAALANSHQRNLVLAGNAAAVVSSAAIQGSPVVSVAGPVSLTSSMNAALAVQHHQQQQQQQQQQQAAAAAAVAASPTLHGLSP